MPRPVPPEVLEDARLALGCELLLRLAWDVGGGSSVFQVIREDRVVAYLKVAAADLDPERARLEWIEGRLPAPRVVSFGRCEATAWLLTTPLPGLDLTNLKHTEPPERIVEWLADALRVVHALPTESCPFGERTPEGVLTHGDACLPNFLFVDGALTGVVDLGGCGLGDPASDLATAVWSVQFNLGPGYAARFLDAYGIDLEARELELVLDADGNEALRRIADRLPPNSR